MYSGLQNGFFENLLIAEFFNCHNDIHSNLHSQISSVVVFMITMVSLLAKIPYFSADREEITRF
jgi:hypothetical protein